MHEVHELVDFQECHEWIEQAAQVLVHKTDQHRSTLGHIGDLDGVGDHAISRLSTGWELPLLPRAEFPQGRREYLAPWLDERPPVSAENDQCQVSVAQILLIRHVLICGNHDFVPCFFRPIQQRAIAQRCPPAFLRHVDVMTDEVTAKLPGRIVVKQDSHARL